MAILVGRGEQTWRRDWSFWQINKCININTVAVGPRILRVRGGFCPLCPSVHFENGQPAGGTSFPVCLRKSSTFRIISYCQMLERCARHAKVTPHIYICICAMFFLWEILWKCFPNWMKTYWLCHDDDVNDGKRQEKQRCWWLTARIRIGNGNGYEGCEIGMGYWAKRLMLALQIHVPVYLPTSVYVCVCFWNLCKVLGICEFALSPAICICYPLSVRLWVAGLFLWFFEYVSFCDCAPAICPAFCLLLTKSPPSNSDPGTNMPLGIWFDAGRQ